MLYLNIILNACGLITAIYLFFSNIFRGPGSAIKRLFGVISLSFAIIHSGLLYLILFPGSQNIKTAAAIYLSAALIINQLFLYYAQIYPRWEKRSSYFMIILTAIPGAALLTITLITDYILSGVSFDKTLIFSYGSYFHVYIAVFAFYVFSTLVAYLFKINKLQNVSFRPQIVFLMLGIFLGQMLIATSLIIFPYFFRVYEYGFKVMPLASIFLLIISNYAISEGHLIDFKKLYSRYLFVIIIFACLFIPALLILKLEKHLDFLGKKFPALGIAIIIYLYSFIFFRFAAPAISRFFRKQYLLFEKNVNEFFQSTTTLSEIKDTGTFWDVFFSSTIDALESRFNISNASFYLHSSMEKNFLYSYGYGEGIEIRSINENSDIVKCLKSYPKVLEKSFLFTDNRLQAYKNSLLDFFNKNLVQAALSFKNQKDEIIGILLLGGLKNGKPYSVDFLSVLDVYRLRFEASLANSIYLDDITLKQMVEHDKMVVQNIKTKIIPKKLKQIEGIRLSSMYQNNSDQGGDFFDSILISEDKLGVFISDISDAGVDSAILALEFYSVLHANSSLYDSPEKLLNILNWVIATSRFSDIYAPVFYAVYSSSSRTMLYSNAAMKPMVIYDPVNHIFTDLDTKGIPVGIDKNFNYDAKMLSLKPGTIGFLYSDGLETATNKDGNPYSTGRIKDIIRLYQDDAPAALVKRIYDDFKNFIQDTMLSNDISLIIFRII